MSRLRTDFYNDLPVEGDATIADKHGLALESVGNADVWPPDHVFRACQTFLWHTGCRILPKWAYAGDRDEFV